MAIIQLSRIQHRRGRKLAGTGLPQLASGELGWAIDTQELYIGNGAVSEGAPAVGNTKILTENDNIFDLINQYAYRPTDNLWGSNIPVERTLQQRLDDTVSIFSFGASGDGTDQTTVIQLALDSLYLSGEVSKRVILWFPAGEYLISSPLKIPPYATIKGAGKDKTIIRSTSSNVFETVNSSSTPGNYNPVPSTSIYSVGGNQCRYIDISDITVQLDGFNTAFLLNECATSKFTNIKILGSYTSGTSTTGVWNLKGFDLFATGLATCLNNVFDNIEVDGCYYSVYSNYDIRDNSWKNCLFINNYIAFAFGTAGVFGPGNPAQTTGPLFNFIDKCKFDFIDKEAIHVANGEYNISSNNKFFNVGNDGGAPSVAITSNIKFSSVTNRSSEDYFERTQSLVLNKNTDLYYNNEYVPEIEGRTAYNNNYVYSITIGQQSSSIKLLKFPVIDNGTIFIDYLYTESFIDVVREGTLELVCNLSSSTVTVNDNYTYVGNTIYSTALQFTANFVDNGLVTAGLDTIELNCINNMPVAQDNFSFSIKTKS